MKLTRKLLKVIHTLLIKKTYKEKRLYLFDEKQEKKASLQFSSLDLFFYFKFLYLYQGPEAYSAF